MERKKQWSISSLRKARAEHQYLRIDTGDVVRISGIYEFLDNNRDFFYLPFYRVIGNKEIVEDFLSDIDHTLAETKHYCYENLSTMRETIDAEIKEYEEYSKTKRMESKSIKFVVHSTKLTGLSQKVAGLPSEHVLDVSNIDSEGKGTRVVDVRERSVRKIGVHPLPIVSSSYEAYRRALESLRGEGYIDDEKLDHYSKAYQGKSEVKRIIPEEVKVEKSSISAPTICTDNVCFVSQPPITPVSHKKKLGPIKPR